MGDTHTTGRASLETTTASSLAVALLVIVAMGASVPVFAGTAAAAGTTDIDVSPADVETTTGETQTFTVTVPEASDGVSAYDFNVSVGDPAVAEITSIDDRTGLDDTNVNTEIAADGATANINAFGANEPAGSVEVIAVTVEFVDAGSTTLDVTVNALGDNTQQVNAYTIDAVTQPTIDVSDIEVGLEPTSQTATVGEDRTYDIVAEGVTDGLGFFDLTVSSSDATVGPITAGEANAPINSTTIADDDTSAQFGGVYNASAPPTGPTVTLGTVTVDAAAAGNTDLTLDITEVGDSNGDEYTVRQGPDAGLTVEEQPQLDPASFSVAELSPQDTTVTAGENFTVSATVTNTGDQTGEQDIQLLTEPTNGDVLATETDVSLAGGAATTVTFENVAIETAGEFNHTVASEDDAATGSLTVEAAGDGGDGGDGGTGGGGGGGATSVAFLVSDLTPQTIEVQQGETITVNATVESDSRLSSTQDVELRIDGERVSTQDVSLSFSDTTATVEFSDVNLSDIEPGEYEFGVYTPDSNATGTLTITAVDGDADDGAADGDDGAADGDDGAADGDDGTQDGADGDDGTDDSTPGFGLLVTLVALMMSLGYLTRRT